MKKFVLISFLLLSSLAAPAATIPSDDTISFPASSVDQVIRLSTTDTPGSALKKVSILVTDHGMSTDVSPRYKVVLTFASLAEMGNLSTSFMIQEEAFKFISATRIRAGVYVVKTLVYDDDRGGLIEVTQNIDATQMFLDEQKQRKNCGIDFCDGSLNTTAEVTETWKKAHF